MYGVVRTRRFERSFRSLKRSGLMKSQTRDELDSVILTLARGVALPTSYRDHQLAGDRAWERECHLKGDLLLVYQRREEMRLLILVDIGTHSQVFG